MTPHTILFLFFVLFVALQLSDIYTTYRILKCGGRELNPVVSKMMDRLGILNGLLAIKIPIILLVAITTWYGFIPVWILAVMCGGYFMVVVHNTYELLKLK